MTDQTNLKNLKNTTRATGLAYLGLAVAGAIGFILVRGRLYEPDEALTTAANLVEHQTLARIGIAADLAVVLTQSLVALWFFKLFRQVNSLAAGAIAAFGFMNAAAVMVATMFSSTALTVALDSSSPALDRANTAQLLYHLNDAGWSLGSLFFGLWLIPMGWLARYSGYMPRPLGGILIIGGIGYILSTFINALTPNLTALADALTIPATIGEFWMIGYLLVTGVRDRTAQLPPSDPASAEPSQPLV
jgi:preprotein translocase subunit Sss1